MKTRYLLHPVARLVVAAAALFVSVSCGGDLLRTGRSPVYLTINSIAGTVSPVRSDVNPAVPTNDVATASVSVVVKNAAVAATALNAVTLTRYRVTYVRADGRNTPGTDVPYGFDGGLSSTIAAGGTSLVTFEVVRLQAKLEPPLKNMTSQGGLKIGRAHV